MPIQIRSYWGDGPTTTLTHMNGKRITARHDLAKIAESFRLYDDGAMIQSAFPYLSPEEREFMMTGMDFMEQEAFFGKPGP